MRALCRSALAARRGPTLAPQARTRAARPMTRHVATGAEGGGSTPTSGPAAVQQMPVQELAELLANPALLEEVQCVDVREEGEWRTARLPHFKLLPLSQSGTWMPTLSEHVDKTKHVVCLCHHGVRSNQMAHFLVQQGYDHVSNVVGGIDAYSRGVDPNVPMY